MLEAADAPLERMAWLCACASVNDEVKAAPLVPKPMSAVVSLLPGLIRKLVLLLDVMVRLVPLKVAVRPAACKVGSALNALFSVLWRSAPERELGGAAFPPDRLMFGMAIEAPPLMENSRCAVPVATAGL